MVSLNSPFYSSDSFTINDIQDKLSVSIADSLPKRQRVEQVSTIKNQEPRLSTRLGRREVDRSQIRIDIQER